jgi:hypothetical protein
MSLVSVASAQLNDNFDSYANDSGLAGQGGWELWYSGGSDATVTDDQAHSAPHSARLGVGSDMVQQFDIAGGVYTFTCWTYVPDVPSDREGDAYIILMNGYGGAADDNWSMQVRFSQYDAIVESQFGLETLPIIFDQWVLFQADIDLDNDLMDLYYDGVPLALDLIWTENVSGGGALAIAALDMYSFDCDEFYFDDIALTDVGGCDDCDGDGICDEDELDCNQDGEVDDCDPNHCAADVAAPFGILNVFDFLGYQTMFSNLDPCADLAAPFGTWNVFDFLAYQTAFGNGC